MDMKNVIGNKKQWLVGGGILLTALIVAGVGFAGGMALSRTNRPQGGGFPQMNNSSFQGQGNMPGTGNGIGSGNAPQTMKDGMRNDNRKFDGEGNGNNNMPGGSISGEGRGRIIEGIITSNDGGTLTIETENGTKTVTLGSSVSVEKNVSLSTSDLSVGGKVTVSLDGSVNSDSLTAVKIIIQNQE